MLHEIKFATRQRLQFIEIMAYYLGHISRSMLAKAYGISDPAATKDLKLYNDLAPENLEYNPSLFSFVPSGKFDEVFADLSPQSVLPMFSQNLLSIDNPSGNEPIYGISVENMPFPVRLPQKPVLAQLIRAMKNKRQLKIKYHSLSHRDDQQRSRIIEPHALVNNGLRWHVRAYDHEHFDFRDYVLSRITEAEKLEIEAESSQSYDDEWMEYVSLQLKPHPGLYKKQRLALNYDYNMLDDVIEIQVRRALVGYLLQQMKVDTTENYSLNPSAYQLIVSNREEIEQYAGWAFM
ncbi:MAG: WYL domain-containing protein [endosymbiont of Galathealinum brachiosum]|uniref:WYL domain-containing protein n=1 Tax=endosymbiont of Galathealinum brachiosum TaxID=2200906 RepID=A0A370DID1_9GAMM|nr:MAG: WYL domain-containing protein [endosymbiont of Galathealinum brachiosum]